MEKIFDILLKEALDYYVQEEYNKLKDEDLLR